LKPGTKIIHKIFLVHSWKVYGGNRVAAPLTFKFDTRWRWVERYTPWPLLLPKKISLARFEQEALRTPEQVLAAERIEFWKCYRFRYHLFNPLKRCAPLI
jgi:hypothetical protein